MQTRIGEFTRFFSALIQPGWFFSRFLCAITLAGALSSSPTARAAERQLLAGSWPAVVSELSPVGQPTNGTRLNLAIGLPVRNPAALTALLHDIYDPASTNYHHYLTPDQFTEQFGPSPADYQSVADFAQTQGLTVTATHPNRLILDVSGTVPDIERALHVTLRTYRHPTENRTFYAPDTAPSLDLATPILSISGLDNFALPHPHFVTRPLTSPAIVTNGTGSGPSGSFLGNDFRAAYAPNTTLTGAGQVVGLVQFDGYTPSDISYYEGRAGLPNVPLQNVLLDGFDGNPTYSGSEIETTLDIEMAIAMAPGLSQVIVYEAGPNGNWDDIMNRMATDNLARQLSCSWYKIATSTNDPTANQIWQQMALQGQSFFASSGDFDAWTGPVNFPEDSPYITQVGGTTLTTTGPNGAYVSETVWNYGGSAGGSAGGISMQYPIPSWQTNISMTANHGSTLMRNTPDVALTADNIYARADGYDFTDVAGTSCAAPLWAGFAALINQQTAANNQPPIGFINPALDLLGQSTNYPTYFHDITVGNNESTASPNEFPAVPGYDLCTGWGTPMANLINALAGPETLVISPATGFNSSGGVGGPFTVTSQTYTLTDPGIAGLTWSLVNTSAWLTVTPASGALAPGGPGDTVTASLTPAATNLAAGTYTATVWFTAQPGNLSQSLTFTLVVNALTPDCANIPGIVDWWKGEDNALDSVGTNDGVLLGEAGYALGEVNQAFTCNGYDGYVYIPDSQSLHQFVTNITIELWLKVNQTTVNADWRGIVSKGNFSWRLQGVPYAKTVNFAGNGLSTDLTGSRDVNDGQWHHVAAGYSGTNIFIYVDGTLDASKPATGLIEQTSDPLSLANNTTGYAPYFFNGLVDEVTLYNRTLSPAEIKSIYLAGMYGKCPVPLVIITQPTNETVNAASSTNFVVTVTGMRPLSFQWELNGTNLVGATNSVLTLTNVQPTNAGIYSVTVTDPYESVTSSNAVLTVLTYPPTIITQPVSQTNYEESTVTFNVTAGGTPPLNYQWFFNSTNLVGATNATLTLTGLQFSQAGEYSVKVSNAYGTTNSVIVVLVVNPPPPCVSLSAGLVDWWKGENNAIDSIGTNDGTLVGGVSYTNGEVDQAFLFDGSSGYVSIPDSPSLDSFATNITIELWLKVNQTNDNSDWRGIVAKGNSSWRLQGVPYSNTVNFAANGLSADLTGTRNVNDEKWHHVAAIYNGTNIYLYVDGTLDASTPATGVINQTSDPLALGNNTGGYATYFFNGLVDEVSLYHRALSASEIQSVYLAGSEGKCPIPPTITTQPTNETVGIGSVATLSVVATGMRPLSFQWEFNGTNLLGATNSVLILTNVQLTNAGNYSVTVTNLYGSVTSSNAVLTVVTLPPFIIQNPAGRTNVAGTTATFTVVAGGTPPLAYQWFKNGTNLNNGGNVAGATTTNLTLTGVEDADAANYTVVVTNVAGSVTSSPALLVISDPPVILIQPTNQVVLLNSNVTFTVTAAGAAPLTYQWLFNGLPIPTTNIITTVAGKHSLGGIFAGDGGPATNAGLNYASGVAVDSAGNIYIADYNDNVIRKVSTSGIITTVAGKHSLGASYSGDGGVATNAGLNSPQRVAVDGSGNLFISDYFNNVVRKVSTSGIITTVAGNHGLGAGYSGDGGVATNAALDNPLGLAVDVSGNLYIGDYRNNIIRKVATNGIITTVAGKHSLGAGYSGDGGAATNAGLNLPADIALDGTGNLFFSDDGNNVVRKVDINGFITTVAGKHSLGAGYSGDGSAATDATISGPNGVALDGAGNLYIGDYNNNVIREVKTNGIITTFAGKHSLGAGYSGDGGAATNAALYSPSGVTLDALANLYIADAHNNVVRKVAAVGYNVNPTNGSLTLTGVQFAQAGIYTVIVSNAAGSTTSSNAVLTVVAPPVITQQPAGRTNAAGTTATFTATVTGTLPLAYQWQKNGTNLNNAGNASGATTASLTLTNVQDADDAIYTLVVTNTIGSVTSSPALLLVVDPPVILSQPPYQVVLPGGTATFGVTLSGTPPLHYQWNFNGTNLPGATNVTLILTNIQVTQAGNYAVTVTNYAGSVLSSPGTLIVVAPPLITQNPQGLTNLAGATTTFTAAVAGTLPITYQWLKNGVVLNNGGNVTGANTTTLTLTNVQDADAAGYALLAADAFGSVTSAPALLVILDPPVILVQPTNQVASLGGTATFSVTASGTPPLSYQWLFNGLPIAAGSVITTVAGNQSLGGTYAGDGGPATNAGMNYAGGIVLDSYGNIYIADTFNYVIRKVTTNGTISTVAGNHNFGGNYSGDGGMATNAGISILDGVAVDGSGNIYIVDFGNSLIRKVDTNEIITTVAGNYGLGAGYSGDGGAATNATINNPVGVAVDGSGNLFIADYRNNVIRKVNTNGIIATVAGNRSFGGGYSGDGGAATNASLSAPSGVAVDGFGNLFIADNGNNVIREVNVAGVITTVAGNQSLGGGYSGDGGAATNAALSTPNGITVDSAGNLFIADYYNNVVRKVSNTGIITTVAGNNGLGGNYSGDGGAATNATLNNPAGTALDGLGNLYIADAHNNVIRKVAATGFNVPSTNSTLILTNVQAGMAGNYSVIVSNAAGSVTSSNAVLTIAPQFHFVWNPIPSPRFVNTPFAVVIQAENGASALATNFTGMVALLSTNGIPVVPAVAANFIQGVWTGAVTVAQTATNLVLSAGDNLGEFGFANPINVVNPPALTTFTSDGTLLLLWPTNPAGFILETTPGLFPANWVPVTSTPFQLNNQYELFLPTSGTNAFFRLYFPGP